MAAKAVISLPKDTYKLAAQKREVLGRKVKKLRRAGVLPASVYGKDVKSVSLQLPTDLFKKALDTVGETGLVGLEVNGDVLPVLIHNVQIDPVTDELLHADFLKVNLAEKVTATVPIEFIGESPAEKSGEGIVVHQMNEIEVEALPTDFPEKITVDVSSLVAVDAAIKVSELKIDRSKVEVKADSEQIVVNVAPPTKEEVVPPPEAEAAAPAEGEVPAVSQTSQPTEAPSAPKEQP